MHMESISRSLVMIVLAQILASAAHAATPTAAAVNDMIASLRAQGATVTVASITPVGNEDRVEIRDLSITTPTAVPDRPSVLSVRRLDVTGLAKSGNGYVAGATTAETLTLSDGVLTLAVAQVQLERLGLPTQDWPTGDVRRPFASLVGGVKALSRVSLQRLGISDARLHPANGDGTVLAQLTVLRAEGFARGRLETLAVDRVAVNGEAPARFDMEQFAAAEIDLAAFARVFDKQTYVPRPPERLWTALAAKIGFQGLSRIGATEAVKIGVTSVDGLQMRTFKTDIVEMLDAALNLPGAQRQDPEQSRVVAGELSDILRVDRASAADVSVETPAGPLRKLTCGGLAVSGLELRGVDSAAASHCQVTPATGATVGFAELTLRDLSIDRMLPMPGVAAADLDLVPRLGQFRLRDGAAVIDGQTISVAAVDVDLGAQVRGIPTAVDAKVTGLTVPQGLIGNPGLRSSVATLGLDALKADIALRGAWRETLDDLEIEDLSVGLADVGRLGVAATLSQIPRATFAAPGAAAGTLAQAGLRRIRVTYDDASLANKVLAQIALANKQPPEEMRKVLTRALPNLLTVIPDATARGKLVFALVSFINVPGTLEITSAITEPVPLAVVLEKARIAPKELPGLLKINAVARSKPVPGGG